MDISKFIADINKIKKHERADNGGRYDGKSVCEQVAKLFENNNRDKQNLARQVADYWLNTYAYNSPDFNNEPSEANVTKICEFQLFLNGDVEDPYANVTASDWEELRDCVNDEAEDLDLDSLQNMMSIVLEKGAL